MSGSEDESAWDSDNEVFHTEEIDAENEAELQIYAKQQLGLSLDGPDADLAWVAWEAFVAPPPEEWTEHVDPEGRVFFFSHVTKESSWSHPGDGLFRELVDIVKGLRAQQPRPTEKQRSRVMQEHLVQTHRRAELDLHGWSGPYTMDGGGEYFYNSVSKESAWESPHEKWEQELALRHALLHRCLLQDWPKSLEPPPSQEEAAADIRPLALSLETLASQAISTMEKSPEDDDAVSLCSARSFVTVRSARSMRSMVSARSARSLRSTPSPASPRGVQRSQSSGYPPAVPSSPTTPTSPSHPTALLRTQSESLPRFGAADSDHVQSPSVPAVVADCGAEPDVLMSPNQAPSINDISQCKSVSPVLVPCKSSPPCKVDHLMAPLPKSPPCKVLEKARKAPAGESSPASVDKDIYSSLHLLEKAPVASPSPGVKSKKVPSPTVTKPATSATPEVASLEKSAATESSPISKMRAISFEDAVSVDKAEGDLTSWLPEHAQRIIKRHLGDKSSLSPGGSPANNQNADLNDAYPEMPVVDNAEVAGGMAADDAAAGDAAVMALVARKCAPAEPPVTVDLPAGLLTQILSSTSGIPEVKDLIELSEKGSQPPVTSELPADLPAQVVSSTSVPLEEGSPVSSPVRMPEGSPVSSTGSRSNSAQFFNLYDADPENVEAQKVHLWLKGLGLARYFEQLASEGFDDMSILTNVKEEEIAELIDMCPMPKLHQQQLRRGLARLRAGGSDETRQRKVRSRTGEDGDL